MLDVNSPSPFRLLDLAQTFLASSHLYIVILSVETSQSNSKSDDIESEASVCLLLFPGQTNSV